MSAAAELRDGALELRIVRDLLQHGGKGLGRYDDSGISVDSFSHPIYREVFRLASDLDAEGQAVHALSIAQAAAGADLSLDRLSGLEGAFEPVLDAASLRKVGERLNALARARAAASVWEQGIARVTDRPEAVDSIVEHVNEALRQRGAEGAPEWPDDVSIGQLVSRGAFLVEPLVPANGTTTIFGPPGGGKTFAAIGLALATAHGEASWLGLPVRRHGAVLYLAAEGHGHLSDRIQAWKEAHGVKPTQVLGVHFETGVPALDTEQAVSKLLPRIRRLRPVLIVVDTLARHFAGQSENDSACMGAFVRGCDRLRDAAGGAAVVILHHPAKGMGSGERGSSALRGAMDSMIEVTKAETSLTLTCSKTKDAAAWAPIDAELRASGRSAVLVPTQFEPQTRLAGPSTLMLRTLVETFGADGADSNELRDVLSQLSRSSFYRARTDLKDRGLVAEVRGRLQPTPAGRLEERHLPRSESPEVEPGTLPTISGSIPRQIPTPSGHV
jgi:hypothetical protein